MPRPAAAPPESRESASPQIGRAVACALRGIPFVPLAMPYWQKAGLQALNYLPETALRRVLAWENKRTALPKRVASDVDVEALAAARTDDYRDLPGPFDCILIGAALGGAAAHLAALLGAPFLPQPFILTFDQGTPDDSLESFARAARQLADPILARNADITVISHFDPVHDGWLTRQVHHTRLKINRLPQAYQSFIRRRLRPGGCLIHFDCRATWMQYRLGPRHRLQAGGWGGLPAETFLNGSPEMDAYLRSTGSKHRGGWRLPALSPVEGRESEWGSEPGLGEALAQFAESSGFELLTISLPDPEAFSSLCLGAHMALCQLEERPPRAVLVETFGQIEPTAVLRARLLPLWLVFNTADSLEFMRSQLAELPPELPVLFSGLVTFSRTPDMVSWHAWDAALAGHSWVNLAAGPRRYPMDAAALWRWPGRLWSWIGPHFEPYRSRLEPQALLSLASGLGAANS
jgi:hypothetical protein